MNIKDLQDLERSKRMYLSALESAASWEYKDHCLTKLAVIRKKIEEWYKEKERRQQVA